jgi:hypothetical protein
MKRLIFHVALLACGTLLLAGCGLAETRAPVPEFMRLKESDPPPPEPAPDVKQLVRDKMDSVFIPQSYPSHVQVSPARRDLHGPGWTSCVRAELKSATGLPISQTYRITISGGVITDRRRIEEDDNCPSEPYEPI